MSNESIKRNISNDFIAEYMHKSIHKNSKPSTSHHKNGAELSRRQIIPLSSIPIAPTLERYQSIPQGYPQAYPSTVQYINVPYQQSPYQQPVVNNGGFGNIISDLSRALDRQQMSGELQQITNTLAQTMLNTMILTKNLQ